MKMLFGSHSSPALPERLRTGANRCVSEAPGSQNLPSPRGTGPPSPHPGVRHSLNKKEELRRGAQQDPTQLERVLSGEHWSGEGSRETAIGSWLSIARAKMKMMRGLTSCISLLILTASCSGYPKECFVNFYNSTEPARAMAKLVLEQCEQTDFSDPNGFATFLTRLVGLHNVLVSERESHPPAGTKKPWTTTHPVVHVPSPRPSWKPQPRGTSPSLAEHSGSPPVPSAMPHREPGQTDSSTDGELSTLQWNPTGMGWKPTGGNGQPTRMDLEHSEPTPIPRGWDSSRSIAMTTQFPMLTYKPIKGMNITTFLMLIHNLMKEKEFRPGLMECLEKSRSPEIAWRTVQANLTRMGRVEASMLLMVIGRALLKAPVEELEKMPVPQDPVLLQAVMNQFYAIHCNQSKEARTAVYQWLRKGLKSLMCPNRQPPRGGREERSKRPQGRCNWLNETTLKTVHLYILDAPYRDLQLIPGAQICQMLNNSQFEMVLSAMYDLEPTVGRQLFHMVSTSCLNITQPHDVQR
ncbi:uncharacterized protein LOC125449732 [Stegostoma tigrinum]|uniref:uncharacterized protein LOC125449732 n=1 Tax=Stegostoma tigrinum TaxID=3053191 RepID=UPI00286FF66F|nr:uncharacterized protein LOC125449732 [Stegostoma tigrinum]